MAGRGAAAANLARAVAGRTVVAAIVVLALAAPAMAADPPARIPGQAVYDLAGVFDGAIETKAEQIAQSIARVADADVVVVSEPAPAGMTAAAAEDRAALLGEAMAVGADRSRGGLVVLFAVDPSGCHGQVRLHADRRFDGQVLAADGRQAIFDDDMRPLLEDCRLGEALLVGLARLATAALATEQVAPGPPFPEPIVDVAVYDRAGVFAAETIASAEATIDAIEARTGAEVVVYSQVVDEGITTAEADRHAAALMDQWGIGRKGIDDGLVILFDLDPSLVHGQVSLYGGPGYLAAYLSNAEKQRIFDDEMLPLLRAADLDGALLIALRRVDENATPEHARRLEFARQADAAVGLILAPIAFLVLAGGALFAWLRYGRDPVYLDDPSIHMAGPPRDLTPAAAAVVMAGKATRRALTAAMLDLASRGRIAFREESSMLGLRRKVGVVVDPPAGDPETEGRRARNDVRDPGPAEELALRHLRRLARGDGGDGGDGGGRGGGGYIEPEELLKFGASVDEFDRSLESHVVRMGWFRERPSSVLGRWSARGSIALVLAAIAFVGALNLPSGGLTMIAGALLAGGLVILVVGRVMQAVTLPGAMIRAMLAAYRRTLAKTMAQARSMDQVVAEAGLDWLETPDQAVVWGTALGLEREVEDVLERSLDDLRDGRVAAGSTYLPRWYGSGASDGAVAGGSGGLFSSSALPSIGGMMAALGTIGNSPSSSGSGGGGFGGGSSGGGGGGSGGGF